MKKNAIILTVALVVTLGSCLTTIPAFAVTNKYIETGTYTLVTTPYFGNSAWSGVQQTTYDVPLQRTHTSYRRNLVFQQLDFLLTPAYEYNVSIGVCGAYSNKFTTCLSSTFLNYLKALKQRYIILDSGFSKMAMYSLFVYGSAGNVLNSVTPYASSFGLPAMNITGTMRAFVAWKGFNFTAPDSNLQLDLQATAFFSSSTSLDLTITTSVVGDIILGGAFFALIGYNVDETAEWPFPAARLNYNTFAGANGSPALYTDTSSLTQDYNTFWGLTRMNIQNQPSIKFTSALTPLTSIQGSSANAFKNLDWVVVIFEFKECDSTTPYYMKVNDTCYDVCPPRFYGDTQFLCQTCVNYDCYQCSSTGTCTVCSNSSDFRVLNAGTNRCDPMGGYYDDGTNSPMAKPCSNTCKTCVTSATNCLSCFDGAYFDGTSACLPCMTNCLICPSGTSCTTCINGYTYDSGAGACVVNIDCSAITNCNTCTSTTGCTQCLSGYIVTNITTCSPVCGDGIKISSQACDDGNSANGDGCSSNCTVQSAYYCGMSGLGSVCGNCSLHCTQCTDASTCQTCLSPYLLSLTNDCVPDCTLITLCLTCHEPIGTNQTLCDSCSVGYVPVNNTCVSKCGDSVVIAPPEECDDGNSVGGDGCSSTCLFETNSICNIVTNKSICSFCPPKKYADSSHASCLNCNYDCATCDSTGCLTCNTLSHRVLNNTTKKCDPIDGFYDDTTNELAPVCAIDCLTCNGGNNNNCLTCDSNKGLTSNGTCILCSLTAGVGCSACAYNSSLTAIACISCAGGNIQNGTCVPLLNIDLPENPMPKMLLLILLPLLLALCCCCLIIYCVWKRRNHDENKVQQEQEQNQKNIENPQHLQNPQNLPNLPILQNPQNPQKPQNPKNPKKHKIRKNVQNEFKPYIVESKKFQAKIEHNETEGNELSMNEFKEINETKIESEVPKEKSEVNENSETSEQSDFSRPSQEEEESRGCHY